MDYYSDTGRTDFSLGAIVSRRPDAAAVVIGSEAFPEITGSVAFYQTYMGVLVVAKIAGLPYEAGDCNDRVFGFHIHGGSACTGEKKEPFSDAGTHFNPENCAHPQHAGDLPPLFGNSGFAVSAVLTNRFSVSDILGRTVIIHSDRDDFTTDPTGDAGNRIACGVIQSNCRNCRWFV